MKCRVVFLVGGVVCEGRGAVRGAFGFVLCRYADAWAYSVAEGFSQAKTATDCFAHICRLYRRDSVDIYY